MRPRCVCLSFVTLLLAMTPPRAFGQEAYKPNTNYERQGGFHATGAAISIDRRAEVFDIVDRGSTYTILADRATVQLNSGKFVTIRDLKDNASVRVTGEQLSARTVLASVVIVAEDSSSYIDRASQGYRPNDHLDTDGYVTRVDSRFGEIDIRTKLGNYVVLVKPGAVIRRYIYVTDIGDVNEGDDIRVIGTVDREGRIVAERIQVSMSNPDQRGRYPVGKGYRPNSSAPEGREDAIEGTVNCPASAFDRSLILDTKYGQRKVDVPKSADVFINQRPGSIHDLVKGDRVRAIGTWTGSTLVATRVETAEKAVPSAETPVAPEPPPVAAPAPAPTPPPAQTPGPNTLTGRIVDIDYTKFELSIDAGLKDTKVDARDASVTLKGSTRRFSELKKGDKVEVKGDWDGDVLKAASVDILE